MFSQKNVNGLGDGGDAGRGGHKIEAIPGICYRLCGRGAIRTNAKFALNKTGEVFDGAIIAKRFHRINLRPLFTSRKLKHRSRVDLETDGWKQQFEIELAP